jgi:hypothetical protein
MKAFASLGTAVLLLSLGTIAPAFAQQHEQEAAQSQQKQEEHAHPQQHAQQQSEQKQPQNEQKQAKQNQQKVQQSQQHAQQQSEQKQQQNEQKQAKQQNHNQQQQQAQRQGNQQQAHHSQQEQRAQQTAWQEHQSRNWQSDHRTWQQRGGYNGYRIPDNRYNGYFGSNHAFVIYGQPYMVVGGFPRFQYGGYWFSVVDPWPSYWASNWYQTQDVYIVYANNGYYMYNQRYPDVGIAISVSM